MIDGKSGLGPHLIDRANDAAVAEFIRTKGITRCPTACVLPTQGSIAPSDRAALAAYAEARDQVRRVRAATRQNMLFSFTFGHPPTEPD
jgi:hypothetical protein